MRALAAALGARGAEREKRAHERQLARTDRLSWDTEAEE